MKKIIFLLFCTFCVAGCFRETKYLGDWVEPIPGMEGVQGLRLEKDGKASSVNMRTLVYETWALQGNAVVVTGKSVGNGKTFEFTERFFLENTDGGPALRAEDADVVYRRIK